MNDIQEKLPRWDHVCLKDGMLAKIQKNVGARCSLSSGVH